MQSGHLQYEQSWPSATKYPELLDWCVVLRRDLYGKGADVSRSQVQVTSLWGCASPRGISCMEWLSPRKAAPIQRRYSVPSNLLNPMYSPFKKLITSYRVLSRDHRCAILQRVLQLEIGQWVPVLLEHLVRVGAKSTKMNPKLFPILLHTRN